MKYIPQDGFPYYVEYVRDRECKALFASRSTFTLLDSIDEKKATYRYAPDKWNIKQIVGHITDHERIKMYRAFMLSRKESIALWGYDQNALVANSRFKALTFQELCTDFFHVRQASISFVEALSESQLGLKGMARQYEVSLEDFLKSIIGHEMHHINMIKERYL